MSSVVVGAEKLEEQASRNLLLHFAPVPDGNGPPPPMIVRGSGCYVEDVHGKRYLDALAGLFTVQLGYDAGEELGRTACQQMKVLPYFNNWGFAHPPAARLAAKLAEIAPGELSRSFFVSTGSEAVESAWKLARQYYAARGERRWKAVARRGAYHGTTLGALSITGVAQTRRGFEPFVPEVVRLRSTARDSGTWRLSESEFCQLLLEDVETALKRADPATVAMVIVEPVQTAGGSLVPPDGYLQGLRGICDRHGILLCSDEVLNGFGRLGDWFGCQRLGFEPDLLTCAKGLSSGYASIGALLCTEHVAATLRDAGQPFNHGSTFGGHPVAAAVALRNLELMEELRVIDNVRQNEGPFRESLEELLALSTVRSVNGLGYLLALELCMPDGTELSQVERTRILNEQIGPELRERGLICRLDDRAGTIIQLAPPLIAGPAEFALIASILGEVISELDPDRPDVATTLDSMLFGPLFGSDAVRECFDDVATVGGWLRSEAALALAQARVGEIPERAAARIAAEAQPENFDLHELARGIAETSHPLVPLIRALGERCGEAGAWVHWGATTQDIVDTGMALQVRMALEPIERDVAGAIHRAVELARVHAGTVMAGRTHGQHAVPITFGLKAAIWADELLRAWSRLEHAGAALAVGQLSGAAGTLATLPHNGAAVRAEYCRILGLADPGVVWHSSRDRIRDLAHALAELAAGAERVGGEIVRHQATELGELSERAGPHHVGSSTMPQKRNPFESEYMIASARLLRASSVALTSSTIHAFERDMAAWAVEWLALPQAVILAGGVAEKLVAVLGGLEVHADRMLANIDLTRSAIMAEAAMMAIARQRGREEAHDLVAAAARRATASGANLLDVLADDPERPLSQAELARLRDPSSHLGLVKDVVAHVSEAVESALPSRSTDRRKPAPRPAEVGSADPV